MSEFASYQQFFSAEEAEPVIALLNEHAIPFKFTKARALFDTVIVGENPNEQYDLRIPENEFSRVTELLLANTTVNIDELDKDYYLFSFSQEELQNIIKNPDEWGRHDYLVAVELLKKRGENVSTVHLQELREQKIELLAKPPKKVAVFWLVVGYLLPFWSALRIWTPFPLRAYDSDIFNIITGVFSSYLMVYGGAVSMLIGISLWRFKKLLPNGDRVYRFLPADRRHGKIIFFLGLISILSLVTAWIYTTSSGNPSYEVFFD